MNTPCRKPETRISKPETGLRKPEFGSAPAGAPFDAPSSEDSFVSGLRSPVSGFEGSGFDLIGRREALRRTALMLGAVITPSLLVGVMQAQPTSGTGAKAPVYLSAAQFEAAGAIAERILPKTETPGARDVGVPAFIDLMYGKYMTPEEKQVFSAGLAEVDSAARAMVSRKNFGQLAAADQDALLSRIAAASQAKEKTFFHLIKELTLLGYFTSEEIGKKVLHYDPIPGRYDGCIPISEVGNVSWTR